VTSEGAREAFDRVVAVTAKPYASLGAPAYALLGMMARAFSEPVLARTLLVASATRDADDPRVVVLADEALVVSPDESARKSFSRGVSRVRLVEALVHEASLARKAGDSHSELRRLARAVELDPASLDEAMRARFAELRPPESMDARREARVRERIQTGDYRGALDAALEGGLGPVLEVADAAEAAGHHTITGAALERLCADDAPADVRVDALRRLGRSYGAYDIERAEELWRRLLLERPGDDEAEVALEDLLTRSQRYPEILDILAVRAARLENDPTRQESHRFVRLRRAALFEQRIGSIEKARVELLVLLEREPDCIPAMRYLADLAERTSDVDATLAMLERIRSLPSADVDSRNEAELRIARILFDAGRFEEARSLVKGVLVRGDSLEASSLRVEIARRLGEPRELGDALAAVARLGADDAEGRSEVLVEAAQAAARAGDVDVSLRRAQEAARVAPQVASVQLFARGLEYRTRGAGSPDEARLTLDSLSQVRTSLQTADVALRAFLMAEASRAITGGGAGLELLLETRAELGPHPLLALGTAERLAAQGRHEDALVAYEEAIVGPLLGMRRSSEVALTASVSAEKIGDLSLALRYAEVASQEPDLRLAALERVRRLAFAFGDERKQRGALRQLVALQQGELRFEAIKDLAGSLLASDSEDDRAEGRALLESALAEAPRGRAVSDELRAWLSRLDDEQSRRQALRVVSEAEKVEDELASPPTEVVPDRGAPGEGAATPVRGMLSVVPAMALTETSASEGVAEAKALVPPPSTREELSAEDIQEVASVPGAVAPTGPSPVLAPARASEESHERISQDPFPPASRDPFPSSRPTVPGAPPSFALEPGVASVERPRERDEVAMGSGVRVGATEVVSLPSILPHVLEGLNKGTFPDGRADAKVVEARALLASGRAFEAEGLLGEAIAEGSAEAADLFARELESQPERRSLLVRASRLAADLAPGDPKRLDSLRQAALADKNSSYARALEHLLHAIEGDPDVPAPPPLGLQTEQPGMFALLTRTGREGLGEAFGLVWEHASTALVRGTGASTSISGLERIPPGSDSLASRLFEATGRLLALGNARLFRRNVGGEAASEVLLGTPPAAVLRGVLSEDPAELGFLVGCAVGAALPHQALLLGQPLGDARVLFRAMLCAFGPPEATRDLDRATAMLGETLWQTLPSKAQRRLSALLAQHSMSSFEDVVSRAKLTALRVGYFVSGDFRCAARAVAADAGLDPRVVAERGAVKDLVRELSALQDLYRLAIRPELADARFFTPSGTGRPGGGRGG
jgi:tetratricopeptide (TPR) repeat protein